MFKLPRPAVRRRRRSNPHMSRATLATHHGKHHAAYIKKTNAAAGRTRRCAQDARRSRAPGRAREGQEALQQRRAGLESRLLLAMPDARAAGRPAGGLRRAIEKTFGSLDAFREEARSRGENHFASGWLWLVADETGAVAAHRPARRRHADRRRQGHAASGLRSLGARLLSRLQERARQIPRRLLDKLANWRFAEAQYEAARSGGAGAWRFPA